MNYIDIKKFREEYNLTQNQLAEICGVSIRAVQSWEQNQRNITQSAIKLINVFKKENNQINEFDPLSKQITNDNMKNEYPVDLEKASLLKAIEKMTSTADKMADTADRNSKTLETLVDYLIKNKGMNINDINANIENQKGDDIVQRNGNDDVARDA